jgi:hypothetical protein
MTTLAKALLAKLLDIDARHGEPIEAEGAPAGSNTRLIRVDDRWRAYITRGFPRSSHGLVARSRGQAVLRAGRRGGLAPNILSLWVGDRNVFTAEFDGSSMKGGDWLELFDLGGADVPTKLIIANPNRRTLPG